MATKTISIELDVYERLFKLKRSSRESFSQVIRRAKWDQEGILGESLLKKMNERKKKGQLLSLENLEAIGEFEAGIEKARNPWK